eukprot:tig00020685_g12954.t1
MEEARRASTSTPPAIPPPPPPRKSRSTDSPAPVLPDAVPASGSGAAEEPAVPKAPSRSHKIEIIRQRYCEMPPREQMQTSTLFDEKTGEPQCDVLRDFFFREGRLSIDCCAAVLERATARLRKEPNLLKLTSPVTIVGDIHGQFYDMLRMFEIGGPAADTQYLFLGDYVDRGAFSTETMLYLCALKIRYPKTVWLLRGNHECRHITEYFNFKTECHKKYSPRIYDLFCEMFDALPLAAVVDKKYFCVHAGISPEMRTPEDVNKINRFRELPGTGMFADLCWSDPMEDDQDTGDVEYVHNSSRGTSYFFGFAAACNFLNRNGLVSILRGHEVQDAGFKLHRAMDSTRFPTVVTLFSAPNYCDLYGNKGAILRLSREKFDIKQFSMVQHPYVLPNSIDALSWSLPFLAESVCAMLLGIIRYGESERDKAKAARRLAGGAAAAGADGEEDEDSSTDEEVTAEEAAAAESAEQRRARIKSKLRAVVHMMSVYKTLREEAEIVCQLKGLSTGSKLPPGLLRQGAVGLREALVSFAEAKRMDSLNERHPDFRSTDAAADAAVGDLTSSHSLAGGAGAASKPKKHHKHLPDVQVSESPPASAAAAPGPLNARSGSIPGAGGAGETWRPMLPTSSSGKAQAAPSPPSSGGIVAALSNCFGKRAKTPKSGGGSVREGNQL